MENKPKRYNHGRPHDRIYYARYYWGEERVRQYVDIDEVHQLLVLLKYRKIEKLAITIRDHEKQRRKERTIDMDRSDNTNTNNTSSN